ncbi:hypothetical protein GCM10023085_06300 [Actinomadura viridis]|uniref:Uncharacterized protein n=1 Tax=Actinomadura viridis TaxID=58110 RepID=A0A931DPZ2_9ACTN|nr:hypothetical protein [Actinomadura viridis]MBG6091646.1 hypothetical protein [Actinomadura viridis]
MCIHDAGRKEAIVAEFIQEHPPQRIMADHPALEGLSDVAWPAIPGCPAEISALFAGLLDRSSGAEALRVLQIVLHDNSFRLNAAMPRALPFLIRLAADPTVPVRVDVAEWVLLIASLSLPVTEDSGSFEVMLSGFDRDRPERAECRTVFAEHADQCRALMRNDDPSEELISTEEFNALLEAAGRPRQTSSC